MGKALLNFKTTKQVKDGTEGRKDRTRVHFEGGGGGEGRGRGAGGDVV